MGTTLAVDEAAFTWRKRHLVEFGLFAGSTFAFQASRLGTGLVAAAVLQPAEYGMWGLALALLSYSTYATLGVLNGANLEIPLQLGSGARDAADRLESSALGFSGLTAVAIAVVSVVGVIALDLRPVAAFLFLGAALAVQQLNLFYSLSLRSRLDFNPASVQQFVLAGVFPAVALPALAVVGVTALMAGQAAAFIVSVGLPVALWRRGLRPTLSFSDIVRLSRVGLPIMAAGFVFSILVTLDRWLTLWLLGPDEVGRYTIAALLSSGIVLVANVIGQQFYPRMAQLYGRTRSAKAVFAMALQQAAIAILLLLPLAIVLALAAPIVIAAWLPQYGASVLALQLLAIGFVALLAGGAFGSFLIVVGRSSLYLAILAVGIPLEALFAVGAVRLVGGLGAIASAAVATYVVVGGLLIAASIRARRTQ